MASMRDNYVAVGLQNRLRARAAVATTPRERSIWSRVAIVHQLVGRHRLDPETVRGIAFLHWLRESGRLGGPRDGADAHPSSGAAEQPSQTSDEPADDRTWLLRQLPARCRRCGRFVRGRDPSVCTGCSAIHCPYCLAPSGCEHLLAVVADGNVSPPVVDPSSIPTLALPQGSAQVSDIDELRAVLGRLYPLLEAYGDGPCSLPDVGHLTRLLPEVIDYPICTVIREPRGDASEHDRDCRHFAWRPDVARDRIGRVIAELGRGFERLAAVTGTGLTVPERPTRVRPRRHRRSEPPVTLIVKCGTEQHRVSLPSRGPIVLLDHPDRQLVEAMLAQGDGRAGCLEVLRDVRGRASYNPYGWYKWLVHVAPRFGRSGSAIRDRLKEFDQRRRLRRLLRDVDLGQTAGANRRSARRYL